MTAPITEDIRAAIVADYSTGMTGREVAERNGVGLASVFRIAQEAGVARGRKYPTHTLDDAIDDYLHSGDSIRVVAGRHPLSEDTLRLELKRRELTRPSGATTATTVKTAAIDDYLAGMTIAHIAKKWQIARSTISAWIAQKGVGIEDRDGESPGVYSGGWVLRGGIHYPAKPARKKVA